MPCGLHFVTAELDYLLDLVKEAFTLHLLATAFSSTCLQTCPATHTLSNLFNYIMDYYGPIKDATEYTISWLVDTFLQRGISVRFLPESVPQDAQIVQKSTRLKGKARKEAKVAMATLKSPRPSKSRIVSSEETLRLAKLLRAHQEAPVVSKRVRANMRRAFQGRRFFAETYAKEQPDNLENAPHAHFASLLSQVVETSTPILFVNYAGNELQAALTDSDIALFNAFEALALPADEADDTIDKEPCRDEDPRKTESISDAAPVLYKPEIDPKEETLLRLYCLKRHVESVTACIARLVALLCKPWLSI